jgi:hypothetical protein
LLGTVCNVCGCDDEEERDEVRGSGKPLGINRRETGRDEKDTLQEKYIRAVK